MSWDWHKLSEDDTLWQSQWKRQWPHLPLPDSSSDLKEKKERKKNVKEKEEERNAEAKEKNAKTLFKERYMRVLPTTQERYPNAMDIYKMDAIQSKKRNDIGLICVKATVVGSTGTGKVFFFY